MDNAYPRILEPVSLWHYDMIAYLAINNLRIAFTECSLRYWLDRSSRLGRWTTDLGSFGILNVAKLPYDHEGVRSFM